MPLVQKILWLIIAAVLINATPGFCAPLSETRFHSSPAVASGGKQIAEEGLLGERLRKLKEAKLDEVAGELKKNPKLIDDPKYLAQHPKLAKYLEEHPGAKEKIKQDPVGFFQHLKEANRQGTSG